MVEILLLLLAVLTMGRLCGWKKDRQHKMDPQNSGLRWRFTSADLLWDTGSLKCASSIINVARFLVDENGLGVISRFAQ